MQIERKSIPATTVIEAAAMLTIPEVPAYAEKIIPTLLAEAEIAHYESNGERDGS